jgi:hypothetical protein
LGGHFLTVYTINYAATLKDFASLATIDTFGILAFHLCTSLSASTRAVMATEGIHTDATTTTTTTTTTATATNTNVNDGGSEREWMVVTVGLGPEFNLAGSIAALNTAVEAASLFVAGCVQVRIAKPP